MRRSAVKVCIRTRPTHQFAQDNILIDEDQNLIQITQNHEEDVGGLQNNRQNSFKFKLDHIFHNSSQSIIYDMFARDTVQGVVDGINGAVMTYGQTGSGKTFTMMGDTHSYEHRGIAPRALGQIFHEISSRVEYEYRVSCTYLELYGEKIFDLLKDLSNPNQDGEYILTEEKDGRGVHVRGLNEVPISNENEALNLLFSGELCKTIAQHKLNRRSNRSHSIFTVYIQQRQKSDINEKVIHSKLHLVDLAGSERIKKTLDSINGKEFFDEITKKESMAINQSLTYLEQCVVALARKSAHVPYRQSKLTNILKDTLGTNCNTLMIACIWGESSHLEETISTLRLASRMMKVENETSIVETIDTNTLIKKQAKLIKALKQELLMHDALVERTGINYEPYTPEQQSDLKTMIDNYIGAGNETSEEETFYNSLDNYRKMIEVCKQFKKTILGMKEEIKSVREEMYAVQFGDGSNSPGKLMGTGNRLGSSGGGNDYSSSEMFDGNASGYGAGFDGTGSGPIYVGDDDVSSSTKGNNGANKNPTSKKNGFGLGVASSDSVPGPGSHSSMGMGMPMGNDPYRADSKSYQSKGNASKHVEFNPNQGDKDNISPRRNNPNGGGPVTSSSSSGSGSTMATNIQKGKNLDTFISTDGAQLYEELVNSKRQLKEIKNKNKECTTAVNQNKIQIDSLQQQLNQKKASRIELLKQSGVQMKANDHEIIDEEEFELMKELKEVKRAYKNRFEQLTKLKQLLNETAEETENYRNLFANEFAAWSAGSPTAAGSNQGGNKWNQSSQVKQTPSFDDTDEIDQLDDQEAFERLEIEKIIHQDPDSLAFFNAQKTRRAHVTQNGSTIRQIHKNKRFG